MTVSILAMCDVAINGTNNSGDACELIVEKAIMQQIHIKRVKFNSNGTIKGVKF